MPLRGRRRKVPCGIARAGLPTRSLSLLAGGHINSNYAVELADGRKLVLRICVNGHAAFDREASMLRQLARTVPAPALLFASSETQIIPYPHMVLEWVDGIPLDEALTSSPSEAEEIGREISEVLLALRRERIDAPPPPSSMDHVRNSLVALEGGRHLGPEKTARLLVVLERRASECSLVLDEVCLVHGDFQGDNILLKKRGDDWRVSAVLDWEWAGNGCPLRDIGSLLRFAGPVANVFHHGLGRGLANGIPMLPSVWRSAAVLWDIAAHCEKLAFPRHRGRITTRSVYFIENWLTANRDLDFGRLETDHGDESADQPREQTR